MKKRNMILLVIAAIVLTRGAFTFSKSIEKIFTEKKENKTENFQEIKTKTQVKTTENPKPGFVTAIENKEAMVLDFEYKMNLETAIENLELSMTIEEEYIDEISDTYSVQYFKGSDNSVMVLHVKDGEVFRSEGY